MLAGCNPRPDAGPVVVSVIGKGAIMADSARGTLGLPARVMADSLAQGLVRFDNQGQIAPGLAERWTVLDNGESYVFRLREANWSDGKRVTAADVVTILNRQIAAQSRNPLAPFLSAIDEIVEMTPEVIEVRLKRPRPDLLSLFAQPELAIVRQRPPGGTGPFRLAAGKGRFQTLTPAFDPVLAAAEDVDPPGPEQDVLIVAERAARALARFTSRQSDLILGGTFVDWPLASAAGIAPANLRLDPAAGLFGLAVVDRSGFLATVENRAAVAQAIDRAALVAAFAAGWQGTEQLLPAQLDAATLPARPDWVATPADQRRAVARAAVERWRTAHGGAAPQVRIALPAGPGATVLFGFVGASLSAIGIEPVRVALAAPADLRLIDAVAPYDSARWYLALACQLCSEEARANIAAARDANDLSTRAVFLAQADRALAADQAFIPLARPLRWSVVALRLARWQPNARAWHPLNQLRRAPT
ncbi:MAG: ABC transporter substrate-binding protein [Sphingomonas sp.]|nr:ABC transporter substrate-binding protein [Sphingomonas sp.]